VLIVSDHDLGTPEPVWMGWSALTGAPALDLDGDVGLGAGRRLVVVAPHPDDEVLGVSGLMLRATRRDIPIEIVAVTDGEASHPDLPDRRGMGARRRVERSAALRWLGVDAEVHHLGLADGRVADQEALLRDHLTSVLDPSATCVCPWRRDGHPDHEAAARAAVDAARRTGACLVEYPIWAWHWATPGTDLPNEQLRRLPLGAGERASKAGAIERFESQIRPVPEAPGDGVVLPDAVLDRFRRPFETYLVDEQEMTAP
jgi:LmbE family N-acetylglucosaminyl deacetylase